MHRWRVTPREAVAIQQSLRGRIVLSPLRPAARVVAGADATYRGREAAGAVLVFSFPELELLEARFCVREVNFPYVPGLLSFREIPALLGAFGKVKTGFDALICDGQGIAHPRRFGLAAHLGLLLEKPSVGCAKSLLTGSFREPPPGAGAWRPVTDRGEVVGAALRTKEGVKPVFVSPGHLVDLENSIRLVMACTAGRRLPEPSRLAHEFVKGCLWR